MTNFQYFPPVFSVRQAGDLPQFMQYSQWCKDGAEEDEQVQEALTVEHVFDVPLEQPAENEREECMIWKDG